MSMRRARPLALRCGRGHIFCVDRSDLEARSDERKNERDNRLKMKGDRDEPEFAKADSRPLPKPVFSRQQLGKLKDLDAIKFPSLYAAGAVLFAEGEISRGIYILCEGQVKLSMTSREGKTLIVSIAEPSEILGLFSALSGTPHEFTAEALRRTRIAFILRSAFLRFLTQHSELYQTVIDQLSSQHQLACDQLRNLGLAVSAPKKLAKLLLKFAPTGHRPRNGTRINLPLTHEKLAECIGTTRETVTRTLNEFKSHRLIGLRSSTLVIRDRDALEKLASF